MKGFNGSLGVPVTVVGLYGAIGLTTAVLETLGGTTLEPGLSFLTTDGETGWGFLGSGVYWFSIFDFSTGLLLKSPHFLDYKRNELLHDHIRFL